MKILTNYCKDFPWITVIVNEGTNQLKEDIPVGTPLDNFISDLEDTLLYKNKKRGIK